MIFFILFLISLAFVLTMATAISNKLVLRTDSPLLAKGQLSLAIVLCLHRATIIRARISTAASFPSSKMHLLVVVALLSCCLASVDSLSDPRLPNIFYPFGTDVGDRTAPVNDDGYTAPVPISIGFPFFNTTRRSLFVSSRTVFFFLFCYYFTKNKY